MSETEKEVAANPAATAAQAGDATTQAGAKAGAEAKFVEQYHAQGTNGPPEGVKEFLNQPRGMDQKMGDELERVGVLPAGGRVINEGPQSGFGNRDISCATTPTSESITPMPDGSVVINSSSTTVCRPNEHALSVGHNYPPHLEIGPMDGFGKSEGGPGEHLGGRMGGKGGASSGGRYEGGPDGASSSAGGEGGPGGSSSAGRYDGGPGGTSSSARGEGGSKDESYGRGEGKGSGMPPMANDGGPDGGQAARGAGGHASRDQGAGTGGPGSYDGSKNIDPGSAYLEKPHHSPPAGRQVANPAEKTILQN